MPKELPDIKLGTIRYRGTFNLKKLLDTIKSWSLGLKYKFSYPKYKHKEGGEGAKVEIETYAFRKINEWVKVMITVNIEIRNFKDVEVIRHGQKEKMNEGAISIFTTGKFKLDPYDRFKDKSWLGKMKDWINEYVLHEDLLFRWYDDHYYEMLKLHRLMKEVLEFETPISAKE